MIRTALSALSLTLSLLTRAYAVNPVVVRAVVEGKVATANAIYVDTATPRVQIGTTTYNGKSSSAGNLVTAHIQGNLVVDTNTVVDACVINSTGSINCLGNQALFTGPPIVGSVPVYVGGSSVTPSAFITQVSTGVGVSTAVAISGPLSMSSSTTLSGPVFANALNSSVLIGTNSYSSSNALDYTHGISSNSWTLVGSSYTISGATICFTNFVTTVTYFYDLEWFNSGGIVTKSVNVYFNNDNALGGTNYRVAGAGTLSGTGAASINATQFAIPLACGGNTLASGSGNSRGYVRTMFRQPKNVYLMSQDTIQVTGGTAIQGCNTEGSYTGSAVFSSMCVGMNQSSAAALVDYKMSIYAKLGLDNSP